MNTDSTGLDREAILGALAELSADLVAKDVKGELCLFGGSVMVLAFSARISTKHVDAIFQPTQIVRGLVEKIGESRQWNSGWLNDGVKGFLSNRHEVIEGNLP